MTEFEEDVVIFLITNDTLSSILLNVKIEIKLKLHVNELDKVKDLIYPSFLWTFSLSNREVKFSNHGSEQSENVIGE